MMNLAKDYYPLVIIYNDTTKRVEVYYEVDSERFFLYEMSY